MNYNLGFFYNCYLAIFLRVDLEKVEDRSGKKSIHMLAVCNTSIDKKSKRKKEK
jgi:hypothetical protein